MEMWRVPCYFDINRDNPKRVLSTLFNWDVSWIKHDFLDYCQKVLYIDLTEIILLNKIWFLLFLQCLDYIGPWD